MNPLIFAVLFLLVTITSIIYLFPSDALKVGNSVFAYIKSLLKQTPSSSTTQSTTLPANTGTTASPGGVYALVNDVEYVQGMYSYGQVAKTYQDCTSVIQCSNYLFANTSMGGANYIPNIQTCELIANDIAPVGVNQTTNNTVLITRSPSYKGNGMTSWQSDSTINSAGDLYCSPILAYTPYAAALCANIPYCQAYTYELDNATNKTSGCLKATSKTSTNLATAKSITYYTGSRKDAVPLSTNNGLNYQYQTAINSG